MRKITKVRLAQISLSVVISVIAGLVLSPVSVEVKKANVSAETVPPDNCPEGSYSIGWNKNGDHICKLEPTGCPFGDSVPLDKCTPPPDITCNEDWTVCEPKKENEGNNGSASEVQDTRSTESKKEYSTCDSIGK